MRRKIDIMFLSSSPQGGAELNVVGELETIIEALESGAPAGRFNLRPRQLGTFQKLQRALLRYRFEIVHIAGHGIDTGLVLQHTDRSAHVIPPETLMGEFNANSPPIQCVILNACYSADQLANLSRRVPFMIVMEGRLSDSAGILFAQGFYDALAAGKAIRTAYEVGRRAAEAERPKNFRPRLLEMEPRDLPLDSLNAPAPEARINAARWLGATQGDIAVSEIVRRLDVEQHPEVRYWSILALGQIGTAEARRALERFVVRDPNDRFAIRDSEVVARA